MRVNSFIGFAFKTLLVFSFLLSSSYAFGALLNLAWDANTESDLAGYKIYYGTSSGQYGTPKDAGNVTTYALTGLTAGTTYFIAATAYDTSGNESTKSNEVSGVAADASQTITVTTNPAGRQIVVDGTTYTAPQTFTWVVDSQHTLNVSSPQSGSTGTRFVFSSWSDGGAQSHTITTPSASTTYTANFTTQYSLSTATSPLAGGTVNPAGTNWYKYQFGFCPSRKSGLPPRTPSCIGRSIPPIPISRNWPIASGSTVFSCR